MKENLWQQTHNALSAGEWGKARQFLDDLARTNVADRLPDLEHYQRMCKVTLPEGCVALLQDRIDLVNSKVDSHHPTDEDPEVVHIAEDADPSIKLIVRQAQENAFKGRRMNGVTLPENSNPIVVPFSWR